MTIKVNKHNVRFPIDEEGNIDVKTGKYDTNNQPKKAPSSLKKREDSASLYPRSKVKNETITDKICLVFDYTGVNIVTIDVNKNKYKNNLQEFESLLRHRHNGSNKKTDKVWLCESVGKLKGVGHQAKTKMNELSIHKIPDIQLHVHHHGTPKVPIRGLG